MKILTVVNNLGTGGIEKVAQNYSIGYRNLNCDTKILSLKKGEYETNYLENENIEVVYGEKDLGNSIQRINKWVPDIIHIHRPGYYDEMNSMLPLIKSAKTKVIETNVFGRPDFSRSAHVVDLHLNLSNWCQWKWEKWSKGLNQIGVILPNLIDCKSKLNLNSPLSNTYKDCLPKDAIILGRIGQPLDSKWDEIIFEVLQDLLKSSNKFYLVVVGLPNSLKQKLASCDELVQKHTILMDRIYDEDKLNAMYNSFDIFLHASKIGESFGMVLAEAHLNKIPIVTLNTPLKDNTQNELVGHNRGGFVVSSKKEMVNAVQILANSPELRIKFGEAGRQHIIQNFDLMNVASKSLKLCEILLNNFNNKQNLVEFSNHGFRSHVNDQEINQLNNNIMGKITLKDKLLLDLIHNPIVFKNYLKFKGKDFG